MGRIKAICISEKKGTQKTEVPEAELIVDYGIKGDAHAGKWHRQVSLLGYEKIEEFKEKGAKVDNGAFGENIIVEGFDLRNTPVGTRFQIGDALLELTQIGKECHSHCAIYHAVGDCIMPREGVFTKVLKGGIIHKGDEIKMLEPDADRPFTAAWITLSDKGYAGEREDRSGPMIDKLLKAAGYEVVEHMLLSDDKAVLQRQLIRLADKNIYYFEHKNNFLWQKAVFEQTELFLKIIRNKFFALLGGIFMKKTLMATAIISIMAMALTACGGGKEAAETQEPVDVNVFIAASLNNSMTELKEAYEKDHPDVNLVLNADSSGTLMTQIQEGHACDIFFSAAQKQMDTLEEEGMVVEDTRKNVVNNQLAVVTLKDSGTKVTGIENLGDAQSLALADGSVPVGKYTRQALMNIGVLPETDDPSVYTTAEVSEALGGIEISEQANVSKVFTAVLEGACEVGTTYVSDTYGQDENIVILQTVPYEITGNVIYPIARIQNEAASEEETEAAQAFLEYVTSEDNKAVFEKYLFDTNVE